MNSAPGTLFKLSHYCGTEDSNRAIASCLLRNLPKIGEASIQEAADMCFVSVATISRFVKNAGYSSYSQFRQAVVFELEAWRYNSHAEVSLNASLDEAMESFIEQSVTMIHKLRNDLDREEIVRMAKLMHEADRICVFTFYLESALPGLQVDLNCTGKMAEIFELETEQEHALEEFDDRTFVLFIKTKSPGTHYMTAMAERAKKKGAKVGAIVSAAESGILAYTDSAVTFDGTNTAVDSCCFNRCVTLISLAYRKLYFTT